MHDLAIGDCNELWTYLNNEADLIARIHKRRHGYAYVSPSDFVRCEGESFYRVAELPEAWRGRIKECYRNAYMLALEHPELTYVEGYAWSVIAMPHAWCVNENNEVIEPTWSSPGLAYCGVRFSNEEMIEAVDQSGHYSVIDDWENGFPMLQKKRQRRLP